MMNDSPLLSKIRIVLVNTSHPGNVGSVARAMKTMGLSDLVLVNPAVPDVRSHEQALALAVGADDLLTTATVCSTLSEALNDVAFAIALTARARDLGPDFADVRQSAAQAISLASTQRVAFVFGSERYGLDNEDVLRCQLACTIPTSSAYSSLNLAQAVQIVAYEVRRAVPAGETPASPPGVRLATDSEREQLFTHLEEALIDIDFINPSHPKRLMSRIRRLFGKANLDEDEVNILRGVCTAILDRRTRQ